MKICQISDTHIGITTEGQLKVMLRAAAAEKPDLLVHCGDYGGTFEGGKCVKRTLVLMRKYFPTTPIISTIGNHDYWCVSPKRKKVQTWDGSFKYIKKERPGPEDFAANMELIRESFKAYNVHFLDKDGLYRHPDFPGVVFIGSSGWYNNPNPPTNDSRWLPIGLEGDTNRFILKMTEDDLFRAEADLKSFEPWQTLIFVSHFPVVNTGRDYKGAFEDFSWRESLADYFYGNYNCQHFLCGHAHQLHKGPLRYECGPDYNRPTYQIIEV